VLSICGIQEEGVQRYLRSFPFVVYYSHLASHLRDCWLAIGGLLADKFSAEEKLDHLGLLVEDHYDLLLYLDDLVEVLNDQAKRQLKNCLIRQCFIPLVRDFQHCRLKLTQKLTLFILSVIFRSLNRMPELLNLLIVALFGRYMPRELTLYMLAAEDQQSLSSYNRSWAFGHFWDRHHDVVARNCLNLFSNEANKIRPAPMSERTLVADIDEGDSPTLNLTLCSHVLFGRENIPTELDHEAEKVCLSF